MSKYIDKGDGSRYGRLALYCGMVVAAAISVILGGASGATAEEGNFVAPSPVASLPSPYNNNKYFKEQQKKAEMQYYGVSRDKYRSSGISAYHGGKKAFSYGSMTYGEASHNKVLKKSYDELPHIKAKNYMLDRAVITSPSPYQSNMHEPHYFRLSGGYRRDNLDWNIADSDGSPNILSELKWTDIEIYEAKLDAEYIAPRGAIKGMFLGFSYAQGWIVDGENQDSDYLYDNRGGEFSRSNNSSDTGKSRRAKASLGYEFRFNPFADKNSEIRLLPHAGYSVDNIKLYMRDGYQTIPNDGPFPNLNSTYEATMQGPFAAMRLEAIHLKHRLRLQGEYHYSDYYAQADWNLRTNLKHPKSFEHDSDGAGFALSAEYGYRITPRLELFTNASLKKWNLTGGTDTLFFIDDTVSSQRLNEVNWDYMNMHLGLLYNW